MHRLFQCALCLKLTEADPVRLVSPQETLPVDNGSEFFVFKVGYVDVPISSSFKPVQMHLGFDSQPNLTVFFTFHQKTRRSFTR